MDNPATSRILKNNTKIFLFIYSLIIELLIYLSRCFSLFLPKLKKFLKDRTISRQKLEDIAKSRSTKKHSILIYCSSAGEYEQAKPIIARLSTLTDAYIQIVFFSESGIEYSKARNENIHRIKSPIDSFWRWRKLLKALRPDLCLIVRYELWPSFLAAAFEQAPLVLIDASSTPLKGGLLGKLVKSRLMRFFDYIFVVDHQDREFYLQNFALLETKVIVAGDTKFDRIKERAIECQGQKEQLAATLNHTFGNYKRFVVGSGYTEDIKEVLSAYRSLLDKKAIKDWQLIIAPHHINPQMIAWIIAECQNVGFECIRFTALERYSKKEASSPPILLVDTMGKLAEIYGLGAMALVGGGFHFRVHNVLEPSAYGLFVACGPLYKNSKEAITLIKSGLITPVTGHQDIMDWWSAILKADAGMNKALVKKVDEYCGAADFLVEKIARIFL